MTLHKNFKGKNINAVYEELHAQEKFEARCLEQFQKNPCKENFDKYIEAKDKKARCEEIINRYKKHHDFRPWEETNGGQNRK